MILRKDGLYEVESESSEAVYFVDVQAGSCTCPHWEHRLRHKEPRPLCKHLKAVSAHRQTVEGCREIAAHLSDEQLLELAQKHSGTPAGCACWLTLAERRLAKKQEELDWENRRAELDARDAAMKAIWG